MMVSILEKNLYEGLSFVQKSEIIANKFILILHYNANET